MQNGIIKKEIQGKFNKYTKLTSESGYCFYDVDEEQRQYMTSILTPITDEAELQRKYVVVYGDADKLNEELQKQREVEDD
jgi:hypothetical protein